MGRVLFTPKPEPESSTGPKLNLASRKFQVRINRRILRIEPSATLANDPCYNAWRPLRFAVTEQDPVTETTVRSPVKRRHCHPRSVTAKRQSSPGLSPGSFASVTDGSSGKFDGRDEPEISWRRDLISDQSTTPGSDFGVNKSRPNALSSTLLTQSRCNRNRNSIHKCTHRP